MITHEQALENTLIKLTMPGKGILAADESCLWAAYSSSFFLQPYIFSSLNIVSITH